MPRPITVKVKREPGAADVPLPVKMTEHAAGFDLHAAVTAPATMQAGDILLVPCGFSIAVPYGYEGQVRPRSGLASKFGISMPNAPGTIDSDYRGEVRVPLINLGRQPFTVERGMRIAQLLILPVPPVELVEVDELDQTQRGGRGFGHTGH